MASNKAGEFAFERTDEGTGTLTYRCMAFTIERDEGGDFTESDLQFLASIVHTLNGNWSEQIVFPIDRVGGATNG